MISLLRFIVSIGAFIASARDLSSRLDPGDYTSLAYRGHMAPSAARSSVPVASTKITLLHSASQFAPSRIFGSRRRSAGVRSRLSLRSTFQPPLIPSSTYVASNTTQLDEDGSSQSPIFTVLPYDGSKELVPYDDRRSIIVYGSNGPREIAVYCRPTSLAIYTGPINFVRFWVDPRYHELVAHIYRPRFVVSACLAKEYSHFDPTDFERWVTENPVDVLLAGQRSYFLEVLGLTPTRYLAIGGLERRFENMASRTITFLYALGILFTLVVMTYKKYIELRQTPERRQSGPSANPSADERDLLALPGVVNQGAGTVENLDVVTGGDWWKVVDHGMMETGYSTSTNFLELPRTTTPESTPSPLPAPEDVSAPSEVLQHPNLPNRSSKVLPTRPNGPRFKTAAWRRCRVK